MNAIALILIATSQLEILPPPEKPTYHVVLKNGVEFYGYEKERRKHDKFDEIVTYQLDEPLRQGTEVVRVKSQVPVATKETPATRERRWKKQFEDAGYLLRSIDGVEEFFPESELNLADRALDMAQAVAAENPPPPPLPEKPQYVENSSESVAEANPPGAVRLWGPQIFLFLFTAVVVAYLVKTFLLKEAETGD